MTAQEDILGVLLSATAEVVADFSDEVTVLREEVVQLRVAMETRAPIGPVGAAGTSNLGSAETTGV